MLNLSKVFFSSSSGTDFVSYAHQQPEQTLRRHTETTAVEDSTDSTDDLSNISDAEFWQRYGPLAEGNAVTWWLCSAYSLVMLTSVLATGNHFLLDAVAAVAAGALFGRCYCSFFLDLQLSRLTWFPTIVVVYGVKHKSPTRKSCMFRMNSPSLGRDKKFKLSCFCSTRLIFAPRHIFCLQAGGGYTESVSCLFYCLKQRKTHWGYLAVDDTRGIRALALCRGPYRVRSGNPFFLCFLC